jgi:hypothetical protein
VSIKTFFVDALTSALDLGIARPEDVLAHATPDVLAQHLPRPLWARLLTACLGAPRVDAQLVIETIGIPNLCEHVPSQLIWACLSEIGHRALGKQPEVAAPAPAPAPVRVPPQRPLTAPPPDVMIAAPRATPPPIAAVGPEIPAPASAALADLINELEASEPPSQPARGRTPTAQRFRTSNTGIGRLGSAQRRPQVAATPATASRPARRGGTEVSDEPVEAPEIAVDDSQLVDWSTNEQTQATDDDFGDIGRKR